LRDYLLLLPGLWLAYQSLQAIAEESLKAKPFVTAIHKFIQNKDLARGVKLSTITNAPLARATRFVLLRGNLLLGESAAKIQEFCQEAFEEQAEILRAKRALSVLAQLVFGSVVLVYVLCWGPPQETWMLLLLGSVGAVMLYEQWVKAAGLAALRQQAEPLAQSLIARYLPNETPYR
jgi:hypothetical protein